MKKIRITREILSQYIFDYGWEKALKLLRVDESYGRELMFGTQPARYSIHKNIYTEKPLNEYFRKAIEKHYDYLYTRFVKQTDKCYDGQSDDDIFHNGILKLMEEEEKPAGNVLEYILYRLNVQRYQTYMDCRYIKSTYLGELPKEEK